MCRCAEHINELLKANLKLGKVGLKETTTLKLKQTPVMTVPQVCIFVLTVPRDKHATLIQHEILFICLQNKYQKVMCNVNAYEIGL